MNDWLYDLRHVLDRSDNPIRFFFRDDDAGWSDAALRQLIEVFQKESVPLDLAVIPKELSAHLAKELRDYKRDTPNLLGFHQHGFSHTNHEPSGRKCEFGISRARYEQMRDIELGRDTLRARLGVALDSIFTPPWNRCTQSTADCLATLGFHVLSRDCTATPLALNSLIELSVNVDWCRQRNGARIGPQELGPWIADAAKDARYVGIMLHHALMDDTDHGALTELLQLLARHPGARCRLMRELTGVGMPGISVSAEAG